MSTDDLEIFLVAPPGLEPFLADEARAAGFPTPTVSPGGVTTHGNWSEVWRANLTLRGATRVLVRLGEFRAFHMAQLDKRARKFPWGDVLRPDTPVRVEAVCKRSKIYHHKGAAERVERAISETLGAPISKDAALVIKVRIDDNLVTISLDSSGESCTSAVTKPRLVRRRCARPWQLCSCAPRGLMARGLFWTQCADRAHS